VPVRALTFDLDDTLWPFAPVAERMGAVMEAWLAEHAPATKARFDRESAIAMSETVRRERPDLANDVGAMRRETLRRMLSAAGDDPERAEEAFAVVYDARQQVELYPDVAPALDRLAARVPLVAVTNGNADIERCGVARWFSGYLAAAEFGVGKPDPRIFHAACRDLGLPPEDVLHVGDHLEADVRGALAAGLGAAWLHREIEGDAPPEALRLPDLLALADALGA
jgi:2-haloalkanoic acid dehalogenase type II